MNHRSPPHAPTASQRAPGGARERWDVGERPISAHRVLGDGHSIALIRPDAEIDWWCVPRPDGEPVLWRLLDERGGYASWGEATMVEFDNVPAAPLHRTLLRHGEQRFACVDGFVDGALVRLVQPLDGPMTVCHELVHGGFDGGNLPLRTATAFGLAPDGLVELALIPGRWQALVIGTGALPAVIAEDLWSVLREKSAVAERRLAGAMLPRHHPERAADALRVLDALTLTDTGAVLASVTTSLPEAVPGDRSFDYRYCWLRDAALSTSIASLLGAHDSANGFLAFAQQHLGDDPMSSSPLAAIDGGGVPTEREVPDVAGWAGAGPVRVGNAADGQVQHDALGLFVEAVSVHVQCGGVLRPEVWTSVRAIADGISTAILDTEPVPSSGVWELREPHLLISEDIGRWLALDRAVWLARGWRPRTRRRRWKHARAVVRARVLDALDDDGRLPVAYEADLPGPDAASLLIPVFAMLRDERATRLVHHVLRHLGAGPFLRRYPPGPVDGPAWDGFHGREGAFLPVSFHAVAALAAVGRLDEATQRMDQLCAALPRLLPEEVDPGTGTSLGNVPLLWTHMELARALYLLDAAQRQQRWGTLGLTAWRLCRYLRLRHHAGQIPSAPTTAQPSHPDEITTADEHERFAARPRPRSRRPPRGLS